LEVNSVGWLVLENSNSKAPSTTISKQLSHKGKAKLECFHFIPLFLCAAIISNGIANGKSDARKKVPFAKLNLNSGYSNEGRVREEAEGESERKANHYRYETSFSLNRRDVNKE